MTTLEQIAVIGTRSNCYYRPDEGHRETDFRCTPPYVFIIPLAAYRFKRAHWHEFVGCADGFCDVTGQADWEGIYKWLLQEMLPKWYEGRDISQHGPSYLITVDTDDGKCAHVGSIGRNNGRLTIGG